VESVTYEPSPAGNMELQEDQVLLGFEAGGESE
jgi:hypothetical protein